MFALHILFRADGDKVFMSPSCWCCLNVLTKSSEKFISILLEKQQARKSGDDGIVSSEINRSGKFFIFHNISLKRVQQTLTMEQYVRDDGVDENFYVEQQLGEITVDSLSRLRKFVGEKLLAGNKRMFRKQARCNLKS